MIYSGVEEPGVSRKQQNNFHEKQLKSMSKRKRTEKSLNLDDEADDVSLGIAMNSHEHLQGRATLKDISVFRKKLSNALIKMEQDDRQEASNACSTPSPEHLSSTQIQLIRKMKKGNLNNYKIPVFLCNAT